MNPLFLKDANMFECMEISEYISEGVVVRPLLQLRSNGRTDRVVEPYYYKHNRAHAKWAGLSSKNII